MGLNIPLIFNTGGYDKIETLVLLNNIVDIYMPDFKFWDPVYAKLYCHAQDYREIAKKAIIEMYSQTGDLKINIKGIAEKGLLIRHLVMPHNIAGTNSIMNFISKDISPNTYVNIMDQYRPCYRAKMDPDINSRITPEEYKTAVNCALGAGLKRLDLK